MNSSEFRTNPMFLRNQFARDGTFEMPVIKKEKIELDKIRLIGYDRINSHETGKFVHFFLDDYKFEVMWKNPGPRIAKLKEFRGVLSPQFSMYTEMPLAVQLHQVFKSRWCGAYFQTMGLKVIPSLVWAEANTYWFAFDGIEQGSIVAVSTVGVRNEKQLFLLGYKEMLKRIKPETIICYGLPFEEMEGNVITVDYAETNNLIDPKEKSGPITKHLVGVIQKGGGSAAGGRNYLPSNQSQLRHIFGNRKGHLPDSTENRKLLEAVANNKDNFIGVDQNNTSWYAESREDGTQIWARVWNNTIINGGVNSPPRIWDSDTGFNRNPFR